MKRFCESIREHEIINLKKLINEQMNSRNYMKMEKFATFVKKNFKINMLKIEKLLGTTVVIQGNIEMPHIAYVI